MLKKSLSISLLVIFVSGCSSVPANIPTLVNKSAEAVDVQAALTVREWENAIKAADAAKKILVLIYPYVKTIDTTTLEKQERESIENFLKGYPHVIRQIDDVLKQKEKPESTLENFTEITDAIKFANTYISDAVDENARIDTVIDGVVKITEKIKGENR
jgi:hypothetical protein